MKKITILFTICFNIILYSQNYDNLIQFYEPLSYKIMKQISPNTGRSPSTKVLDINYWGGGDYNKYVVTFQSQWIAKKNIYSNEEIFAVVSNAFVDGNNIVKYEIIRKSESVANAWSGITSGQLMAVIVGASVVAGAVSSNSNSSSKSSSNSSNDYAPKSMNGVEIVETSTFGSLAVEHACLRVRNKNNYDVIVTVNLKQNGIWKRISLVAPEYSKYTDYNGYSSSEYSSDTFTVKANSIRSVGLTTKSGSGRPTDVKIVNVK